MPVYGLRSFLRADMLIVDRPDPVFCPADIPADQALTLSVHR